MTACDPPRLDRTSHPAPVRPNRIVHLGLGAFSRAHQAWYTETADPAGRWGILGFTGRRPALAQALEPQQGLYTLIERGAAHDRLSVIGAVGAVRTGDDLPALADAIAAPATAIVTLTVTEAGYAPAPDGRLPSAPARIARGLAQRHRQGRGPLAVVSCDNLRANGTVLRERTLAALGDHDAPAAAWAADAVAFVSTSVDRITPPTTSADRALVTDQLGLVDAAPVVCEPFTDWVLCGAFPAGRPAWERSGARIVDDIEPWELRKLWLLNGGHSLLAYLGLLRGHATVAEAVRDHELVAALESFWDLAAGQLPSASTLDLPTYREQLRERFANPRIGYPLTQIAGEGLDKLRNRVAPVAAAALAAGAGAEPALLVIAAWARWLIDDPRRADSDHQAPLLHRALAEGGPEDQADALLTLLDPGWPARAEVRDVLDRLRARLGRAVTAAPPTEESDEVSP